MIHSADLKKNIRRTGWLRFGKVTGSFSETKEFLESLAFRIGRPVQGKSGIVESIVVRKRGYSKANSLSGKYGLGQFPLHCETSHWSVPCRFVLLSCYEDTVSSVPTLLLDSHHVELTEYERNLAHSAIFFISNGINSFYSTVLSTYRPFIRLDPGCMEAVSDKGMKILDAYSVAKQQLHVTKIHWEPGDILIIDNWRVLHGRDEVLDLNTNRTILRVLVR